VEVVQEVVLQYLVLIVTMVAAVVPVHIEKALHQSPHPKRLQFKLVQAVPKELYCQQQDHHLTLVHQ
jgi:hypothetical protein